MSETMERAPHAGVRDQVVVTLPAAGAYLSVLRTATAGLASRIDFTLDDIEDLRIAVDEACALLLADAAPGSELRCAFELADGYIKIDVTVPVLGGSLPSRDSFAWTVLSALAGEVDATTDDGDVTVTLTKRRRGDLEGTSGVGAAGLDSGVGAVQA